MFSAAGSSNQLHCSTAPPRNKLTEAIQGVLADTGPKPGTDDAMLLAYLYRADGDDAAALKSAQQVPEGDLKPQAQALVHAIRIERHDWTSLLSEVTRDAQTATDSPTAIPRTTALVNKLSYARLAGDDKAFDEALTAIRQLDFELSPRDVVGVDLILNDRVKEGIDLLVAGRAYHTAYVILMTQGREDDARRRR